MREQVNSRDQTVSSKSTKSLLNNTIIHFVDKSMDCVEQNGGSDPP